MSERVKKVPLWVFGLLVAGALTFGAKRALAEPAFLVCDPPGWNGGTCTSQQACEGNCDAIFGMGGWEEADCIGGCCRCLF